MLPKTKSNFSQIQALLRCMMPILNHLEREREREDWILFIEYYFNISSIFLCSVSNEIWKCIVISLSFSNAEIEPVYYCIDHTLASTVKKDPSWNVIPLEVQLVSIFLLFWKTVPEDMALSAGLETPKGDGVISGWFDCVVPATEVEIINFMS